MSPRRAPSTSGGLTAQSTSATQLNATQRNRNDKAMANQCTTRRDAERLVLLVSFNAK